MLHTALGYPHCGEGAWGSLQFLTSRQHFLIGEQPSAQSVWAPQPYVGCARWEFLLFRKASA